jgi:hypothetical protein
MKTASIGDIRHWRYSANNMMKKRLIIPFFMLAAIAMLIAGGESFAGTDAAAFLNNGVGGKPMGMGGAFTSICDDVTAIYWNPAGIARLNRYGITAMGQSLASSKWDTLKDIAPSYQFIGIMVPVNTFSLPLIGNRTNTFGFGMINSSLSGVSYTYLNGANEIVRDTMEDTENAYYLTYGFPVWETAGAMYLGASVKYITQQFSKISGATATGYDMDVGLLYRYGSLGLGAVLQRGVEMNWANGRRDTSPLTAKAGRLEYLLPQRYPFHRGQRRCGPAAEPAGVRLHRVRVRVPARGRTKNVQPRWYLSPSWRRQYRT